ncbi:MAG: hypothetical protein V2A73_12795 [Pseudomonadota bacterium]
MRRILVAMILGALMLALAGPAMAQKKKGTAKAAGGGGDASGGYQKVKTYDFSGDTISGELQLPDGDIGRSLVSKRQSSLIRIRQDFIKEIVKSAEDL